MNKHCPECGGVDHIEADECPHLTKREKVLWQKAYAHGYTMGYKVGYDCAWDIGPKKGGEDDFNKPEIWTIKTIRL